MEGGRHSWLLSDPETLPAIVGHLLGGSLGDAWARSVGQAGLDPAAPTLAEVQSAMLAPNPLAGYLSSSVEFIATGTKRPPGTDGHRRGAAPAPGCLNASTGRGDPPRVDSPFLRSGCASWAGDPVPEPSISDADSSALSAPCQAWLLTVPGPVV